MSKHVNSKKYQKIVATGRDLFWKHGFKRISIDELCEKAEVSKMTFYKFFSNKLELAKTVFDQEVDNGVKEFKSLLREDIPTPEKIRKMVQMKIEGTNNISREFLEDFYSDKTLELKAYAEQKTKEAWTEILNDFRYAQEKGWFRSNMKPELLFFISRKMAELITDENLLKLYDTPQELVLEFTNLMVYGIAARDQSQ